jgi:acyl-CoA reductase-like NAD-dependent aldehyde dehydrogenase
MSSAIKAVDPRTGEALASYEEATLADVEAAVAAAVAAKDDPALADASKRAAFLRGAAARLRARADEIVALAGRETGLPPARLTGELARTTGQLEAFADVIANGDHHDAILDSPDPSAAPPRPDLRRTVRPLGPVAVFGASNFPLAFSTAGGDTASALASGCPVVVKGHPAHPGTSTLVAEEVAAAAADAGLPAGTFGHVLAASHEVGGALVDHPDVAAVAFTGSHRGGRALMDRAAARPVPIPVYAEMGSLNPVVVTEAALAARAGAIVEALAGAVANFGGQLCTKPGLVLVPEGDAGEAFTEALAAALAAREPEVLLAESIDRGLRAGLASLDDAGVTRLTPAGDDGGGGTDAGGFHARPVVHRARAADLGTIAEIGEEHFGPATIVLTYTSLAEAAQALLRAGGQLSATVHAEPVDHPTLTPLADAAARVAGRIVFDGVPTGVAVSWAMTHGGPYPAASDAGMSTSVGLTALRRFLRPVTYQDAPQSLLPPQLQDGNPLRIWRRVDGVLTRE